MELYRKGSAPAACAAGWFYDILYFFWLLTHTKSSGLRGGPPSSSYQGHWPSAKTFFSLLKKQHNTISDKKMEVVFVANKNQNLKKINSISLIEEKLLFVLARWRLSNKFQFKSGFFLYAAKTYIILYFFLII